MLSTSLIDNNGQVDLNDGSFSGTFLISLDDPYHEALLCLIGIQEKSREENNIKEVQL